MVKSWALGVGRIQGAAGETACERLLESSLMMGISGQRIGKDCEAAFDGEAKRPVIEYKTRKTQSNILHN